jgi:deoxyhypusine synthase
LGDCTRGFAKRVLKEREGGGVSQVWRVMKREKANIFAKKYLCEMGFCSLTCTSGLSWIYGLVVDRGIVDWVIMSHNEIRN